MNRFIHRIVSSSSSSSSRSTTCTTGSSHNSSKKKVLSVDQFLDEILPWAYSSKTKTKTTTTTKTKTKSRLSSPRLIWFGEFHSEERIIAFQNELVERLLIPLPSSSLSSSAAGTAPEQAPVQEQQNTTTTIHIVMEHFSIEMQEILNRFQTDESYGFDELKSSYQKIGTEGHQLDPYKELLLRCKSNTTNHRNATVNTTNNTVNVQLHGGFIPRPLASRWYRAGQNQREQKQDVIQECYEKNFLPSPDDPRHHALFATNATTTTDNNNSNDNSHHSNTLLLQGSSDHFRLVRSMMSGEDLYALNNPAIVTPTSPTITGVDTDEAAAAADQNNDNSQNHMYLDDDIVGTPIGKLYQAQLLKDHVMGYHLSNLIMNTTTRTNTNTNTNNSNNDIFLIIAGMGHMKHYLGVPERLDSYLQAATTTAGKAEAEAESEGGTEMMYCEPPSIMIGSQMLYETYIEDRYEPLKQFDNDDDENIGNDDDDENIGNDDDDDDDKDHDEKLKILNDLYTNQTDLFDKLIVDSDIIRGGMFEYRHTTGQFDKPSADYCFVYDEDDENLLPLHASSSLSSSCPSATAVAVAVKAETKEAYNKVGGTANKKGNLKKAQTIMKLLQYTPEDMTIVGDDCLYNFQGVANPHLVAQLLPGEHVLDVGSGCGVDSLLASHQVTNSGMVVGVDLAVRQVAHSKAMLSSKNKKHITNIHFIQGDAEQLSVALERWKAAQQQHHPLLFDVCISNGAFCLIPDKKKAFSEVYRALKPGGRMAISTTTIQSPLDTKVEWPVCMQMFANLEEIPIMCQDVGFIDVQVIDADSPMEQEFDVDIYEDDNPERFKIHGTGQYADQYSYLEKMDMDSLCQIVTVYGRKPLS